LLEGKDDGVCGAADAELELDRLGGDFLLFARALAIADYL
jgi:hypothetical protein